jgi:hypothetical protein
MTQGKWERDMKSKGDAQQLVFVGDHVARKPPRLTPAPAENSDVATCPFCLFQGPTAKFVVSLKHGFSKRLGQCPECKNQALWTTLHRRWKVKEFALWVYKYSFDGYWNKCKYVRFNTRLRLIGQLDNFWNEYRRLKGDTEQGRNEYAD